MHQIICARTSSCGFRVHERYFYEKPQFHKSACPRCGGPLRVVDFGTDNISEGQRVDHITGMVG